MKNGLILKVIYDWKDLDPVHTGPDPCGLDI